MQRGTVDVVALAFGEPLFDGRILAELERAAGTGPIRVLDTMVLMKDEAGKNWRLDLEVKGNILDHEYHIGEGRDKVAEVSKKWFRIRDSYGVQIEPGQDDVVILAVTVCIDQMAHG